MTRKNREPVTRATDDGFDAAAEVAALRARSRAARKRHYSRSRLDRYARELLALRDAGATTAQLQRWVRDEKRVVVVHSTVARWLRRQGGD